MNPSGTLTTMTKIELGLPWAPSINNYYGIIRGSNRRYIKKPGREFRDKVVQLYQGGVTLEGDLKAEIIVYPPDRRRRDLDNLMKAVYDSLTHAGVYADDSQIISQTHKWGPVIKPGYIHVTLSPSKRSTTIPPRILKLIREMEDAT